MSSSSVLMWLRSTSLPPPLCHAIAGSTPLKASQRWVYKRGKEIVVDLLPPCSVTIGAEGKGDGRAGEGRLTFAALCHRTLREREDGIAREREVERGCQWLGAGHCTIRGPLAIIHYHRLALNRPPGERFLHAGAVMVHL